MEGRDLVNKHAPIHTGLSAARASNRLATVCWLDLKSDRLVFDHGVSNGMATAFHDKGKPTCVAVLFAASVWLQVADCRALAAIPEHHIMLTGERSGSIKIFQWKAGMA